MDETVDKLWARLARPSSEVEWITAGPIDLAQLNEITATMNGGRASWPTRVRVSPMLWAEMRARFADPYTPMTPLALFASVPIVVDDDLTGMDYEVEYPE